MARQDGTPVWISGTGGAERLPRVELDGSGGYDEAWLQELLFHNPDILPIDRIEPGFNPPISVCRELPLQFGAGRSGALDNVFVTSEGGLVLVEAKLWRNPQARREVVAQAMDYAAAIFRLDYARFEAAVLQAQLAAKDTPKSLVELVRRVDPSVDEITFCDGLTRNLRLGRAIVAVVGDGVREDVMSLAELLQSHAGHRFTFALVELGIYEAPGGRLVSPSVLAQTVMIERGVVEIVEGSQGARIVISEPKTRAQSPAASRAVSISEEQFYEALGAVSAGLPSALQAFIRRLEPFGIYADFQRALNLKHDAPAGNPLNLATITKDGWVDTGPASWWGRRAWAEPYNAALAEAIGGQVKPMQGEAQIVLRTRSGKTPKLADLLPAHEQLWVEAIRDYVRMAFDAFGN